MANGDAAAAAGMDVVAGTADRRMGYDEINKTRDYIAQRTSTVQPIEKGGTAATDAAGARTNLSVYSKAQVDALTWDAGDIVSGTITRPVNVPGGNGVFAAVTVGTAAGGGGLFIGGTGRGFNGVGDMSCQIATLYGTVYAPTARATTVSSGYVAAYLNSDGRLASTPSATRFKQDIVPKAYTLADAARIGSLVVNYRLIEAVEEDPETARVETGILAEALVEAGFPEFVVFTDDGQCFTIDYARMVTAAFGALTDVARRLEALEGTK